MDGPRPCQELSDAQSLGRVLRFRDAKSCEEVFAVDHILDITGTSLVTVVRSETSDDEPDQLRLRESKDWEYDLFRDHAPASPATINEKASGTMGIPPHPHSMATSKLLLVMVPPEAERAPEPTASAMNRTCEGGLQADSKLEASIEAVKQTARDRLYGFCRGLVTGLMSLIAGNVRKAPAQFGDGTLSIDEKTEGIPTSTPNRKGGSQRLRRVPFTSALFRAVTRRMSIHSCIIRLISRANVPSFERTFTEMPLYSSSGESLGPRKAILYNCRTSNEWEGDMALSVTHFPAEKITFALLIGPSEEQQGRIMSRLRRAGADTAHPMLLPAILAELERGRQMEAVDDIINELEEQLTRIGQETVSSWQLSSETKAQRNRQKTEAWLNATFSKNILLANVTLLYSMRRHLNEFQALVHPTLSQKRHRAPQYDPTQPDHDEWRPETPQFLSSTVESMEANNHPDIGADYPGSQDTLIAEPVDMHEPEAKYRDALKYASMRMADRLTSIIGEYDDKIRQCTMEVDGMAMATQWSHGETNMEIATASGEDSSQMRSIALVTMVFLPGTFFASMFSMTFFNWNNSDTGGDHAVVSSSIWIYVLVTVVFTLVTLLLFWYFILSRQRNRRARHQEPSIV